MIYIKSNDDFYLKNIIFSLNQKELPIINDRSSKYFFELDLHFDNESLRINTSNEKIFLKLPISFEQFFSEIKKILINKFVTIKDFNYGPVKQSISYKDKTIHLNYIHNIIIANLILNKDSGIDKFLLYQLIWPNDKDAQINKLDTHITNLKNKVVNELNIDLKIITSGGILKLIID
jgi:DNA-binding response OmpR family regulator